MTFIFDKFEIILCTEFDFLPELKHTADTKIDSDSFSLVYI